MILKPYKLLKKFLKLKRKNQILIVVCITVFILLCGYLFFFLVGPFILAGPPLSLYYITNRSAENHTIIVEIFDEKNNSVHEKTYNISPEEHVSYERRIGWEPKISLFLITWSDGTYNFHFTVDNKYSEWYTTGVSPSCGLYIRLFNKDSQTQKIIPIEIGTICT